MTSPRLFLAVPVIAAAALAVTMPIVAKQAPGGRPAAPDLTSVTAGTYTADHEHTLVRWELDHLGVTPYFGLFGQIQGTLTIDPKNVSAAKVDVTIPVSKVTTASPGLTAHLLKAPAAAGGKPDFFGPTPADARFVSTSVTQGSKPHKATITGNLTLNGVTKPVTLDAEFYGSAKMPANMGGKSMIGFEAETTIKRSDFGIDMAIPMVSDAVKLDIVAAFGK